MARCKAPKKTEEELDAPQEIPAGADDFDVPTPAAAALDDEGPIAQPADNNETDGW